jgi:predicted ATP-binding protein involved in virulence
MKLERLSLANYRGFDQVDLKCEPDVTLIAGVNGVGKSALLSAIVKCTSHALPRLTHSKEDVLSTSATDIKSGKESLSISAQFKITTADVYVDIARSSVVSTAEAEALTKRRDELRFATRETKKGSKEEEAIEQEIRIIEGKLAPAEELPTVRTLPVNPDHDPEELINDIRQATAQPLTVFYSTSRFLSRLPPMLPKTKGIAISTAYSKALDQLEISLNDFVNWYRVQSETGSKKRTKRVFQQLDSAIATFLQDVKSLQLHPDRPPRFSVKKNSNTFFLEQLSDGERGLLALVFDLTRRLAIANPESDNPIAEGVALVLIDEIELHLHPKWQRDVLGRLRSVFQNCQFVVTTHSPLVLGEVEARCVRFLEFQDGKVVPTTPTEAYGMDANRILQELMGAPVRNKQMERKLHALFELIDAEDFSQAREKIAALELQLGEHEPELTRAQSLITFLEGSE